MNNISSELLESQARRAKDPHMSNYDSIVGGLPIRLDFKRYAANLASQKDVMGKIKKKGVLKGVLTATDKFNNALIEAGSQALKVAFLAIQQASKKWTMPLRDWRPALNRFIIEFGDRLDGHL